jgi:hypothetical protein
VTRCGRRFVGARTSHVTLPVTHQVTVVCSVHVHELRSDTHPREQIPTSGTSDQTLAHNPVIRESHPASRKFRRGAGSVLRGSEVGHRRCEQGEREDGPNEQH